MAKIQVSRGATTSQAATNAAFPSATAVPATGAPAAIQVLGTSTRQWAEAKELRKLWDANTSRRQYLAAANMANPPANLASIGVLVANVLTQLSEISISFEGMSTKYSWGSLLGTINSLPFSAYFGVSQTSDSITPQGSDPYAPTGSGNQDAWGFVVFNILDIGYSSRFGGSFCVTLTPSEDCGIELRSSAKKIAVNLNRWVLKLYIRASTSVFDQPPNAYSGTSIFQLLCSCEIDCRDSEAYEIGSNGALIADSPNVLEADIDDLVRQAEGAALARLEKLARFTLGWVHQVNIPSFNRVSQNVSRLHVSDGSCRFELTSTSPMIAVDLKIGYLFTSEGPFDDERELTAEPWITGRTPPFVRFSFERSKYIGNALGTGWMRMGYVAPADILEVHELTVFPLWTEDDPISDDEGGAVGSVFNVTFDANTINQRIATVQPGTIGPDIYTVTNDPLLDWTSYSIEIRFVLLWA